jgi:hypothetical protein
MWALAIAAKSRGGTGITIVLLFPAPCTGWLAITPRCNVAEPLALEASHGIGYKRSNRTGLIPNIDPLWELIERERENHRCCIGGLTIPLRRESATGDDSLRSHLLRYLFDVDIQKVVAGYYATARIQSLMRFNNYGDVMQSGHGYKFITLLLVRSRDKQCAIPEFLYIFQLSWN